MSSTGRSQQPTAKPAGRPSWPLWLAALSAAGAALSGYLWRAKVGALSLICGPVGDCVTVNSSAYSEVFGIPVALLGTLMYSGVAVSLLWEWRRPGTPVSQVGFMLALAGALFSLYLTGVETFVLRAYCIWCLTSWVMITAIAWTWGRHLRRAEARA